MKFYFSYETLLKHGGINGQPCRTPINTYKLSACHKNNKKYSPKKKPY